MNSAAHTRTLRGAISGMVAAGLWAAEQPLDKLLLESPYDDVELLGKAVRRGRGWYPIGLGMHVGNGAIFGAIYSNVATAVPLAPWLRGPALALAQNAVFWPLGYLSDRFHPARRELPKFRGNRRAYAQSVVRHLIFGLVLGELERRLNASPEPFPPGDDVKFSTNGHGSIDRAASSGRVS